MDGSRIRRLSLLAVAMLALAGCNRDGGTDAAAARLCNVSDGSDWAGYGRTFGQ